VLACGSQHPRRHEYCGERAIPGCEDITCQHRGEAEQQRPEKKAGREVERAEGADKAANDAGEVDGIAGKEDRRRAQVAGPVEIRDGCSGRIRRWWPLRSSRTVL
jgi:hypothetical protein